MVKVPDNLSLSKMVPACQLCNAHQLRQVDMYQVAEDVVRARINPHTGLGQLIS